MEQILKLAEQLALCGVTKANLYMKEDSLSANKKEIENFLEGGAIQYFSDQPIEPLHVEKPVYALTLGPTKLQFYEAK